MGVRVVPMVGDAVDDLPPRCRSCVFWELGRERPSTDLDDASTGGEGSHEAAQDRVRKQGWVTAQSLEAGPPGVLLRDSRRTIGYALYAAARAFPPRGAGVPTASSDALVLATAWLDPEARGAGHGHLLVQAAIKEALRLDLRAVEAWGDRLGREQRCVVPAAWLAAEGFEVAVEHARYPLFRLDTRRVVRWAESLEHAVEGFLGRSPRRQPVPQHTAMRPQA